MSGNRTPHTKWVSHTRIPWDLAQFWRRMSLSDDYALFSEHGKKSKTADAAVFSPRMGQFHFIRDFHLRTLDTSLLLDPKRDGQLTQTAAVYAALPWRGPSPRRAIRADHPAMSTFGPISRHEDESLACPGPLTLPGLFNLLEGHAFDRDNEPTLPYKLCHMAIDGRSSL